MKAFKFITKISENGTIQIPYNLARFNKETEIIILPKLTENEKEHKTTEFVEKWAGFLKKTDIEYYKHDYLVEKYK